jgi:NAD+ kinase
MKRIVVIANREKPGIDSALAVVNQWAGRNQIRIDCNLSSSNQAQSGTAPYGPFGSSSADELRERFAGADLAITLGGDGTLLFGVQLVAPLGMPVLAVNLGSLGFHTQALPESLEACLDAVKSGEFRTESRVLLQASVQGPHEESDRGSRIIALNDIVVTKSAWGHMVHVRLHINGTAVADISADGLIISTPTGSTAYNLAAGGPVLLPGLEVVVINAICPHRMRFSPLVLPANAEIQLAIHRRKALEEAQILADGQTWRMVTDEETLKISKAPVYLPLIVFQDDFFDKLRTKLHWGGLI